MLDSIKFILEWLKWTGIVIIISLIIGLLFGLLAYFVKKADKKNKLKEMFYQNDNEIAVFGIKIPFAVIGWSIILLIALWVIKGQTIDYWGNGIIGSFFEKDNYTTQYWVYLQPNSDISKNYRIIGDINRDCDSNNCDHSLMMVYWPNRGTSEFDDCDLQYSIKNNLQQRCTDNDGQNYEIKLGEKVK